MLMTDGDPRVESPHPCFLMPWVRLQAAGLRYAWCNYARLTCLRLNKGFPVVPLRHFRALATARYHVRPAVACGGPCGGGP